MTEDVVGRATKDVAGRTTEVVVGRATKDVVGDRLQGGAAVCWGSGRGYVEALEGCTQVG